VPAVDPSKWADVWLSSAHSIKEVQVEVQLEMAAALTAVLYLFTDSAIAVAYD
jgi:hypothetical protein